MFDTEDQRKSSLLMKYLLNFRDVDLRWLQKEHTDGRYLSFSIQSDYFAHNSTELQHQICIYIIILTQLWISFMKNYIYTPTLLFDFLLSWQKLYEVMRWSQGISVLPGSLSGACQTVWSLQTSKISSQTTLGVWETTEENVKSSEDSKFRTSEKPHLGATDTRKIL